MFRIKICGITRVEDAHAVANAGADAIGLNFYRESPRCVSLANACLITDSLPSHVTSVGVFVNHTLEQVASIVAEVHLDMIQLHGDEPVAMINQLSGHPIVRAIRCRADHLHEVCVFLDECAAAGCSPAGVLIDAHSPGQYGGTGQVVEWSALRDWSTQLGGIPLVLAGGLNPENVATAIETAKPAAVDTASGVESRPGVKDHRLVESFVASARNAFASLE